MCFDSIVFCLQIGKLILSFSFQINSHFINLNNKFIYFFLVSNFKFIVYFSLFFIDYIKFMSSKLFFFSVPLFSHLLSFNIIFLSSKSFFNFLKVYYFCVIILSCNYIFFFDIVDSFCQLAFLKRKHFVSTFFNFKFKFVKFTNPFLLKHIKFF